MELRFPLITPSRQDIHHQLLFPQDQEIRSLNGNPISSRISGRDLGVNLSSDLSWSLHIQKLLQKAYGSFHLIRQTFPPDSTPTHIKKHLYLALVLPLLTYASPVWRPKLLKDIIALEFFQRRATRYLLNYPKSADYTSRLTTLQILPIMYRLELNDLMFYVTSKKNASLHFDISQYISEHSTLSLSTRSKSAFKLKHMHSSTNTYRHFYFNRLPRLWNFLPPETLIYPDYPSRLLNLKLYGT